MTMDMEEWEQELAQAAFARKAHVPHSWDTVYDSGNDGCMPAGWYLLGLDAAGQPITFPVRHEYGPYSTQDEANAAISTIANQYQPTS